MAAAVVMKDTHYVQVEVALRGKVSTLQLGDAKRVELALRVAAVQQAHGCRMSPSQRDHA